MVLTLADTPSSLLAQQSRWFCSAEGLLPRLSSILCPSVTGRCSFQVAERGSLPRLGGGAIAQRWLLQPLSSASESASWGSSPTAACESPVRQNQKAWRLPRGAVEPGGSVSTVGSLSHWRPPWAQGLRGPGAGATPLNASPSRPPWRRGGGSLTFVPGVSRPACP